VPFSRLIDEDFLVDLGNAGLHVDVGDDEIWRIERKRHRPQELAVIAIESPDSAAFAHVQ
jgi:hypothetical protein